MRNLAIGYIRVSTQGQVNDGISLQMQVDKIRAYASLNDLELVGIYGDSGISAKTITKRPALLSVIHMAKKKRINQIVVYKLDRLARNTVDCLTLAKTFDKVNCSLHSITEKLDTQSAIGKFFFSLIASLAQMERELISERTKAALESKRQRNEKLGGQVPLGFQNANGILVFNTNEQLILDRVRTLKVMGFTVRGIASKLDEENIKNRKGHSIAPTQIARILKKVA